MKKVFISVAVLFIISTTGYAKKASIFANSGLSFPSAPKGFSDSYNMGWNLGAGLEYSVLPLSLISIRGTFDYNNFPLDTDDPNIEGGNAGIILISGAMKVAPPLPGLPLKPYLLGEVGYFQFSIADITSGGIRLPTGYSKAALSLAFGAGVDFSFIPLIDLFVEGNYVIGFTEDENTTYFPIKVGFKIGI